ncbi:uncharacterized protein LOC144425919 [Styela clava]
MTSTKISELHKQNDQNDVQPSSTAQNTPDIPATIDQDVSLPEITMGNTSNGTTTNSMLDNRIPEIDLASDLHEFSSSTGSNDLKEISNWSECEDPGNVLSPPSTPPNQLQQKPTRQSSRLKQTSTIGNTPFHPTSKGNAYVKVMLRNIDPCDLSTTSVFDSTPDEISSAPANLEYNKSNPKTPDSTQPKLDNKRYRDDTTSSDSSFSTSLEVKLVGKKKK